MKVLLDTCTILWCALDPSKLSSSAQDILTKDDTRINILAISAAEIACAVERNKIELNEHWKPWFRDCIEQNSWHSLSINLDIIEEAYSLPEPFHQDPADRLLVACARLEKAPIITADKKIIDYPHVKTIW